MRRQHGNVAFAILVLILLMHGNDDTVFKIKELHGLQQSVDLPVLVVGSELF